MGEGVGVGLAVMYDVPACAARISIGLGAYDRSTARGGRPWRRQQLLVLWRASNRRAISSTSSIT